MLTVAGGRTGRAILAIVLLLLALFASKALGAFSIVAALTGVVAATAAFVVVSWSWILRDQERAAITGTLLTYRSLSKQPG